MTSSRSDKVLFYVRLGSILWLLGLPWIVIKSRLENISWLMDAASNLHVMVLSAITIAAIVAYDERQARNSSDNFRSRMMSALSPGVAIVLIWGFARWLSSLVPPTGGRLLDGIVGASVCLVMFAPFIAGATEMTAREAIPASVRFIFTLEGIRTLIRPWPAVLLAYPAMMWIIWEGPSGARDTALGILMSLVGAIAYPVWGTAIWARFREQPAENPRNIEPTSV